DYDPALALFADDDGLADYKTLIPIAHKLLRSGGHVFFEVGKGQADKVADVLAASGFDVISLHDDLAGVARVVHGAKR
ncbi:MAG: peptide chain release factor N(5)-glutamine methyltransferase, partial [Sphingomonadales bacterium]|nr:peptide chain release factor N(5)-glutamine methyltransferase [Sphingomonadales bacterium]